MSSRRYGAGGHWRRSLEIRVKAADVDAVDRAIDEATVAMRIRHRLRPSEKAWLGKALPQHWMPHPLR